MGEASLETSPKSNMIQDIINSDNMNFTESTIPNIFKTTYFAGNFFLLLAERAKTGWHSDTIIHCFRYLLSLVFVMDICIFVRLDTSVFSEA